MNDETFGAEIAAALDEAWRPAPALLAASMSAIRAEPRRTREWPRVAVAVGIAIVVVATLVVVRHALTAPPAARSLPASLPAPSPVAISTDPAAQVAWLDSGSEMVGIDPSGAAVGHVSTPGFNPYITYRSPDRTQIVVFNGAAVDVYSALNGRRLARIARGNADPVAADAYSPDGRYLAVLASSKIEVFDLRAARTAGSVDLPGTPAAAWGAGSLAFAGPSTLYAFLDYSGHPTLMRLAVDGAGVHIIASAVDGAKGHHLPLCPAPDLLLRALAGGRTLVTFCHQDGGVTFVDGESMNVQKSFALGSRNPFGANAMFTPDLHLLYVQYGSAVVAVDLVAQRVVGPGRFGSREHPEGALGWLGAVDAQAGGVASTVPISPDGLRFYLATNSGIEAYRVPRLEWLASLAPGVNVDEVWVSGDGSTLYATVHGGGLAVVPVNGGAIRQVALAAGGYRGFVSSDHG